MAFLFCDNKLKSCQQPYRIIKHFTPMALNFVCYAFSIDMACRWHLRNIYRLRRIMPLALNKLMVGEDTNHGDQG